MVGEKAQATSSRFRAAVHLVTLGLGLVLHIIRPEKLSAWEIPLGSSEPAGCREHHVPGTEVKVGKALRAPLHV